MTDQEAFEANRELLFAVAYRMLGTVADAEDKLQGLAAGRTLSL